MVSICRGHSLEIPLAKGMLLLKLADVQFSFQVFIDYIFEHCCKTRLRIINSLHTCGSGRGPCTCFLILVIKEADVAEQCPP